MPELLDQLRETMNESEVTQLKDWFGDKVTTHQQSLGQNSNNPEDISMSENVACQLEAHGAR